MTSNKNKFLIARGMARLVKLAQKYGRDDPRVRAYDKKLHRLIVEEQREMMGL